MVRRTISHLHKILSQSVTAARAAANPYNARNSVSPSLFLEWLSLEKPMTEVWFVTFMQILQLQSLINKELARPFCKISKGSRVCISACQDSAVEQRTGALPN